MQKLSLEHLNTKYVIRNVTDFSIWSGAEVEISRRKKPGKTTQIQKCVKRAVLKKCRKIYLQLQKIGFDTTASGLPKDTYITPLPYTHLTKFPWIQYTVKRRDEIGLKLEKMCPSMWQAIADPLTAFGLMLQQHCWVSSG